VRGALGHTPRAVWQVLNCVQRAARGGETMLVDGLSVARRLAEEQPAAFAYLSRTPLPCASTSPAT
jgi:gamma-butyrobetaine dioxygenase